MATARSSARDADDLCWLPATELAALIRRRKVSPVEVVNAVLARIDAAQPAPERLRDADGRSGAARRPGRRAGARQAGRDARAAARRAVLGEGPRDHQGRAHDVRHAALPRQRADRGRADRGAHEGRRRHHAGQDEHADLRLDRRHPQPPLRDHAQSLEPRSHAGRLQRRRLRGGRGRARPAARRHRRRRLDPDPRVLHGHLRLQGLVRPRADLSGQRRLESLARRGP